MNKENSLFIVFEGVDSSGKETQAKLTHNWLKDKKLKTNYVSFPRYENPATQLVTNYLMGKYGNNAKDVNPYQASMFFIVDRLDEVLTADWPKYKTNNEWVISDRYSTSNLVHQGSKIDDQEEFENYLKYMTDLEYGKLNLPEPDIVFFLDVPYEFTFKMNKDRKNKITNESKKDIHESDQDYIKKSYYRAIEIAEKLGWYRVHCVAEGKLRTPEDINNEIKTVIENMTK